MLVVGPSVPGMVRVCVVAGRPLLGMLGIPRLGGGGFGWGVVVPVMMGMRVVHQLLLHCTGQRHSGVGVTRVTIAAGEPPEQSLRRMVLGMTRRIGRG